MKTNFLFFALCVFSYSPIFAQEINLELTTGRNAAKLIFAWDEGVKNESVLSNSSLNYSFAVSGQIYKFLYLKTAIGSNSLNHFVDIGYTYQDISGTAIDYEIFGWYQSDQIYMGFYPEFRMGNDIAFYVNAGFGFYNHLNNRFTNGYRSATIGPRIDAIDIKNLNGNSSSTEINIGVNPKIGNVGIVANIGYTKINPTKKNSAMPGIGSKQWNFRLGVGYTFAGKKETLND